MWASTRGARISWTVRTITAIKRILCLLGVTAALVAAGSPLALAAQRERTRLSPRRTTPVTESQASELTLTMTDVAVRPLQVWVRTAGALNAARTVVEAIVPAPDAARIRPGQRVRAFSPESRSRMYQATVTQVRPHRDGVLIAVAMVGRVLDESRHYLLEIVTEDGEFLSIPNEAIIESGGKPLVYVREPEGDFAPRDITLGVRGELFTEVREGLEPGQQVVTIGSFFIDAEYKLKGP